jgi:hypothetical protein
VTDYLQPPHDTVDDVEPLCSVCGGACDGKHDSGAGDVAAAAGLPPGSGSQPPLGGASFSRCKCGDADCFMEVR